MSIGGDRLILLGTAGGPGWSPTRHGIASALVVGGRFYLVDAGEGVAGQLCRAFPQHGVDGQSAGPERGPLDKLGAVFITHLHSDHVSGLASILTTGMFNGLDRADRIVEVWGPGPRGELPPAPKDGSTPIVVCPDNPTPGTQEVVATLVGAFATDFNDRAFDNNKAPPDHCFVGRDVQIPPEYLGEPNTNPHPRMSPVTVFEDDRVRVSATLVQHAPVFPALAYRFDTDQGSVVFSGDTSPSENLIELATGATLLVHEVIAADWVDQIIPTPRGPAAEATRAHLLSAHTTAQQVGRVAERAGAEVLVLSHIVPPSWPAERWAPAQEGFSGQLIVGRDLLEVPLARSAASA